MSHDEDERQFEEQVRELLAEDAYAVQPSQVPYPAIRQQGTVERRRRVAAVGAALVTLVAVPVGAYALTGGTNGADTATPSPSVTAPPSPTPTPSPTPSGPSGPATDGQLLDGIDRATAVSGVEDCLAYSMGGGLGDTSLGEASDYRILLAMRSTGDSNAPGDGHFVVAVREKGPKTRLICNIKDGEVSGRSVSSGDDAIPDAPVVMPDINAHKLYMQSVIDRGNWRLPFRWASIGTVEPSVARVTVSYGDETSEAVLDDGWFVAAGELNQQVTRSPHVKGYDADGKLVYDSDRDKYYIPTLP
ncbi:hypothetical protein SSP24_36080 [Streptomyces spinoverrucosus]|uniref:Uncharacterized protein n=1 Tax=Streptomyces spinoverrucosus TaxID=284043 RepID=A0A4Y3VHJ2_9ACTN|nr:hypothetical protein [Streptomyces spinoverrucosus]GEC05953.1 hypothetical protein SSP24_36080 [Streptomyces spinoverrucosus]GHB74223.1 hypothetical protein GCM10010397_50790 [Streptomyces spinoverrucosus]